MLALGGDTFVIGESGGSGGCHGCGGEGGIGCRNGMDLGRDLGEIARESPWDVGEVV